MKKIIVAILALIILFSTASAETLTSLLSIQGFMMTVEPKEILWGEDVYVNLTGKVVSVPYVDEVFHIYRIECFEDYAQPAYLFGYNPCFYASVSFPAVFEPGDYVRVEGKISALYSSPLIPFINATQITFIPD